MFPRTYLAAHFISPRTWKAWTLGALGVLLAGVPVASCGAKAETNFTCAGAYTSLCGKTCTADAQCDLGLHCASGACTADCSPSQGCAAGQVCSLTGTCGPSAGVDGTPCSSTGGQCPVGFQCNGQTCQATTCSQSQCPSGMVCMSSGQCGPPTIIISGAGGSSVADSSGTFQGDGCVNLSIGFEGQTPTVVLLVDRSGSMADPFPAGQTAATRWTVLRNALMDPATGAVKQLESTVRMGLTTYTSNHGTGGDAGRTCPILSEVAISLNNYTAINATYQAARPEGDTPTGASIAAAASALANEPSPKYILLVTDGQPDTCADPDASNSDARQKAANDFSVQAAQAAYAQGIGLFIMGVSSDIAPAHLQAMANAGAGLDPTTPGATAAKYYVASDNQAALATQLSGIIGSTRTCIFHLQATVDPGHASEGTVIVGGTTLAINDPNGYRLNNASELEILGSPCEKIKNENTDLVVRFPCDAVQIIR